jgi:archaellum component FlaC
VKAAWLSITSPKRKEGKAMRDNNTQETNQSRSFEERVFLRFDAVDARLDKVDARLDKVDARLDKVDARLERIDARLDSLDGRVEKLEMKQYDTKPIWEQALASIAETNERMHQGFEQVRSEMKSEFAALRHEIDHSLHGVELKIDALNHNILQVQADQRYADRRLQELETQIKPTG